MINNKCRVLSGLLKLNDLGAFSVRRLRILLLGKLKTRKVYDFCH